jgi:hypothetical protein
LVQDQAVLVVRQTLVQDRAALAARLILVRVAPAVLPTRQALQVPEGLIRTWEDQLRNPAL